MFEEDLNQEWEHVGRAIIYHIEITLQGSIDSVIEESIELHAAVVNFILKHLDAFLNLLVRAGILDKFNAKLAGMKTDIDELKAQLL